LYRSAQRTASSRLSFGVLTTVGKVIDRTNSSDLIEGVRIDPLQNQPDDRGFLMELARPGKGVVLVLGMVQVFFMTFAAIR
jgi:hypothetical protein